MDELDWYLEEIVKIARACVVSNESPERRLESLLSRNDKDAARIVEIRASHLIECERHRAIPLLATSAFATLSEERRVAALEAHHDISNEFIRLQLQQRLGPYRPEHHLFQTIPPLWNKVRGVSSGGHAEDLIQADAIKYSEDWQVLQASTHYVRLEHLLPSFIPSWVCQIYPGAPCFVRIDPLFATKEEPHCRFEEVALVPANPRWWRNLGLLRDEVDGAVYRLDAPENPREDRRRYWDFHIRGVRRLDVGARRRGPTLSIMVEELSESKASDGLLYGRCIHCDTQAAAGKRVEDAVLDHIDLAINVYDKERYESRMKGSLRNGKVVDANWRSHLLRLERVPTSALPELSVRFFRSQSLVAEWFKDQRIHR